MPTSSLLQKTRVIEDTDDERLLGLVYRALASETGNAFAPSAIAGGSQPLFHVDFQSGLSDAKSMFNR